ncbi:putative acetyltransferase [Paenibacillus sp. JGP012]|uniref:GNAT family N-acetyltransferase n=1 Tax=Paenibacillus sp. JGP012 TaxID=2735914 RepID=UPI00161FA30D|nr:GNAT family N-acetyltransferase [Paenibacillus sp. JGP012]MBB6022333.1 putative acetyltransferase [Paenibacillus sp. JGP012]
MKIEKIHEYDINGEIEAKIQELLTICFPKIYPAHRIYFKQLPQCRFLAFNRENQLVGHVGLDYRVMNLNGEPIKILGVIDLCVSPNARSEGIGSLLLSEVEKFSEGRNIDFILLFADNMTLYSKNGYTSVGNKCKWLKIDNESLITKGIGYELIDELMVKAVGKKKWINGDLDLLGYLF